MFEIQTQNAHSAVDTLAQVAEQTVNDQVLFTDALSRAQGK